MSEAALGREAEEHQKLWQWEEEIGESEGESPEVKREGYIYLRRRRIN